MIQVNAGRSAEAQAGFMSIVANPTSAAPAWQVSRARTLEEPGVRVYIVEDDPAVRFALQLLVRSYGWDAVAFESGQGFLAARFNEDHACLVLDLNLPSLDGEEVLRRLRARGSQLPVVVITVDREGPRLDRMLLAGASSVLLKPFGDAALHSALHLCLGRGGG